MYCRIYSQLYKKSLESKGDLNKIILETYDKGGHIVAGDWDGMALGNPPGINPEYTKIFNTFSPQHGQDNQFDLMIRSEAYLKEKKEHANSQPEQERSAFDKLILKVDKFQDIVSDFALARAGCVTPHEFVFQQLVNHAYRDEANQAYGESYDMASLQAVMDSALEHIRDGMSPTELVNVSRDELKDFLNKSGKMPTAPVFNELVQHLQSHLILAIKSPEIPYQIPHVQHDSNIQNLYQHGFDMRNPYGSNLEGAWLIVLPDGGTLYGKTQEALIEVILTGDFLQKNQIDINHGANMSAGWDKVIARQIELKQSIPEETMIKYIEHQTAWSKNAHRVEKLTTPSYDDLKVNKSVAETSHAVQPDELYKIQRSLKDRMASLRESENKPKHEAELDIEKTSTLKPS